MNILQGSFLLFAVITAQANADWAQVSTTPSRANAIYCMNSKGSNAFVGTLQGAAYRLQTTSNNWQACNWVEIDSALPIAQILDFTFDNSYTYCLTGAGIYRTDSLFKNWQLIYNKYYGYAIYVFGTSLFYGCNSGIFRTTNSGASWTSADTGLSDSASHSISTFSVFGNYLLAGSPIGVSKSNNNGHTWSTSSSGMTKFGKSVLSISVLGNRIFAGTSDGIFISTDTAKTWVQSNAGLPPNSYIENMISVGNNVVCSPRNSGVYISNDSGKTWYSKNTGLTYLSVTSLTLVGNTLFAGTAALGVFVADISSLPIISRKATRSISTGGQFVIRTNSRGIQINNLIPNGNLRFSIYSPLGKCIYSQNILQNATQIDLTFGKELPAIPAGEYLLQLIDKEHFVYRNKIFLH